jgi:Tfp pilus assembly protein PilV
MTQRHGHRGTSLVEAVIAIGLLTGAVLVLASLATLAVQTNARARARTLAALSAAQKLESLAVAAQDLIPSPSDALETDAPGFVDFVDASGRGTSGQPSAVFVRRWRVSALGGDASLLVLTVEAAPCRRRSSSPACGDADARVRLTTVRSRIVR